MSNNRIYYAIQQVAIRGDAFTSSYIPVRGLQSVGITTNFNLAQVFQIGQLALYENIEEIPEVQITLNKVLDGNIPIYCLATRDAVSPKLTARANTSCVVNLGIFSDDAISANGTPTTNMETSGMFVSSVRYQFPKDGNFSEEVTLMGNNKVWRYDARVLNSDVNNWKNTAGVSVAGAFTGDESPVKNVARRQDIKFGTSTSGSLDAAGAVKDIAITILPREIPGISSSGTNNMVGNYAHINNISTSVTLNRENNTELGRRAAWFKTPTFPAEVTTEIECMATTGDGISATEAGILSLNNTSLVCGSYSGNLSNNTIRIATCEGLRIYCGTKNKLSSVNYTGGDTGGGNVNVSYSYRTFNDFVVLHTGENLGTLGNYSSGFATATGQVAYLV